jgi:uncharacterized membrane protein YbhN (UPF0104 family)
VDKRTLWTVAKYLLAFGLLGYVIWANWDPPSGNGLKDVWERHVIQGQPIHYGFLALALFFFAISLLLTLCRWYLLVRAQGLPITLPAALRIGLIGFFYNTFLPGSVGGDVVKAAALARRQSRRTVAVATVIMDRVIALWGLIWFVALLGGAFWMAGLLEGEAAAPSKWVVSRAAAVVAASVVGWLLLGLLPPHRAERFAGRLSRIPKVGGSAAEFWRAVWMYRCRQGSVALTLLLSWVGHVGFVLTFYFSTRTLWDPDAGAAIPSLTQHFLIVPIGLVIQAMPLFPGGVGIGELGFGGLYRFFGCDAADGVLGSLVQRVLSWVLGVGGYLVALRLLHGAVVPSPAAAAEEEKEGPDEMEPDGVWSAAPSEQITPL